MHLSAPPHPRSLTALLPSDPCSARVARRLVDDLLEGCDLDPDVVHDAEIVVSELVSNAVLHGVPSQEHTIGVTCAVAPTSVVLAVHDDGDGLDGRAVEPRPWSDERDGGRGLAVVDGLSESWSVDRSAGTTVTARLTARLAAAQSA